MIERDFDVAFVAELAPREERVQQDYGLRMPVHERVARPPGTLHRALILSESRTRVSGAAPRTPAPRVSSGIEMVVVRPSF